MSRHSIAAPFALACGGLLLAGCANEPAVGWDVAELEARVEQALEPYQDDVIGIAVSEDGLAEVPTTMNSRPGEEFPGGVQRAVEICEAAAAVDGITDVVVKENHGAEWVRGSAGQCAEI